MTWGRVDDQLHAHPKAEALGDDVLALAAVGLWSLALSWSCDQLTDGRIPAGRVTRIVGDAKLGTKLVARLRAAKLWHGVNEPCPKGHERCDAYRRDEEGFRFHDWEDYQPTRAEVEAERERKADAGRRGGLARARARAKQEASSRQAGARPVLPEAAQPPLPSRPDPTDHTHTAGAREGSGVAISSTPTDHVNAAGSQASGPITRPQPIADPLLSPEAAAALALLRTLPDLALLATPEIAEALAANGVTAGRSSAQIVEALRELNGKASTLRAAGDAMPREALLDLADRYVRAKPRAQRAAPRGAPAVQRSPGYEAEERRKREAHLAEAKAKIAADVAAGRDHGF